eukprot:gene7435-1329_t
MAFANGAEIGGYQVCCNGRAWQSEALSLIHSPALHQAYNSSTFVPYVKRWSGFGGWFQPDPCAPVKGMYRVDFGPNGKGGCILDQDTADGVGRFPMLHGKFNGTGDYTSPFASVMWHTYAGTSGTGLH